MMMSASAKARASLVLLEYSWGSVLGSVTTLWTRPWPPSSWVAMLPQKFSAATILSCLDAPTGVDASPQAATVATTRRIPATTDRRRAGPLRLVSFTVTIVPRIILICWPLLYLRHDPSKAYAAKTPKRRRFG